VKILKWGTVERNELGGVTVSGFHFDCEGTPFDLKELMDWAEELNSMLPYGVNIADEKDWRRIVAEWMR